MLYCPIFEVLYEGTRGPGKTDALLMDFAQHVGKGHGEAWRGILFRQTYKQLADVIAKSQKWFKQIWGDGARFVSSGADGPSWTFPGGEKLLLRHFAKADDYWNYHGHEYPWIAWEELCNWADDAGYRLMMSCCRSSDPNVPRKYRSTTNPYGPGHNWVKQRFRLPGSRFKVIRDAKDIDGRKEPHRVAIHGHIRENRILLAADPDYIDRIAAAARNPAELKAWLEGSWDIVAGGMFDDVWDEAVHIVRPFRVPQEWRRDRAFDWGSSHPFSVGWWAESDGSDYMDVDGAWRSTVSGDLFRVREWYGWNGRANEGNRMLAVEISQGIIERELAEGDYSTWKPGPADSSIFAVENGMSIAVDMQKPVRIGEKMYKGTRWTAADKRPGSRITGWEMCRKRLKQSKSTEPGRPREKPGMFIVDGCEQFRRTFPVLPRDDKKLDDVNTDAEDHIGDEVRYRVRASDSRSGTGKATGMY